MPEISLLSMIKYSKLYVLLFNLETCFLDSTSLNKRKTFVEFNPIISIGRLQQRIKINFTGYWPNLNELN